MINKIFIIALVTAGCSSANSGPYQAARLSSKNEAAIGEINTLLEKQFNRSVNLSSNAFEARSKVYLEVPQVLNNGIKVIDEQQPLPESIQLVKSQQQCFIYYAKEKRYWKLSTKDCVVIDKKE